MKPKNNHGGPRKGAGRPEGEPSVTIRMSKKAHKIFVTHAKEKGCTVREAIDVAALVLAP